MTATVPRPARNGVDVPTLFATLDAVKGQPEIAQFQFRASNEWVSGTHNRSTIQGFFGAGQEDTHPRRAVHLRRRPPGGAGRKQPRPDPGGVPAARHRRLPDLRAGKHRRRPRRHPAPGLSTVEGDIDLLGILGLSDDVRNGYRQIRVHFDVEGDASPEELAALVEQSRRRRDCRSHPRRGARRRRSTPTSTSAPCCHGLARLGASPARIGHQLLQAGDVGAAAPFLLQAARTDAAIGAYRDALAMIDAVRQDVRDPERGPVLALRADMLMATGDAGAVLAYREALGATGDPAERRRLLPRLARAATFAADYATAAEALDGLEPDGSADDARAAAPARDPGLHDRRPHRRGGGRGRGAPPLFSAAGQPLDANRCLA